MKKHQCERIHTRRRAFERYGVNVNREQMKALVAQIQGNKSILVEKQTLTRSLYVLTMYDGQWVLVAYNKTTHQIVTFLPREALLKVLTKADLPANYAQTLTNVTTHISPVRV